jgi:hypothetical protein
MRHRFIAALLLVAIAPSMTEVALARPVTLEPLSTFGSPDPAYDEFATDVAIDGDYALATASRSVADPGGDPRLTQNFATAFMFHRRGTRWELVRRMLETQQIRTFPIPLAVAMQNGLAAVQTARTDIWKLTATGWVRQTADLTTDGPGGHLVVDSGRALSGDGTAAWNARVFEADSSGTWHTSAVLQGKPRAAGGDDQFRGGAADLSGAWAVVMQPDGEDDPVPEAYIFHDYGGTEGWYTFPYGSAARPPGASRFGNEVAIQWPDVFVSGSKESGTYLFREAPAAGFALEARIQAIDSFMGSGPAGSFAHTDQYLLQQAFSHDRNADVVNVFRRSGDGSYEHVAVLAAKNGESLGRAISISGRRVLVGGKDDGLVHYFVIPLEVPAPAPVQDTFASGNGTGWETSAGSTFGTAPRRASRVLRQTQAGVLARAVLADVDFTSEAIEADVRPINFATPDSSVGLVTRYQGPENYFEAVLRRDGIAELRRMAGGTLRVLASTEFRATTGRYYRVRLESVGTLHRLLIDGQPILDADASGPTHGRAALVTDHAQAEFDNVVVSPTLVSTMYATDFEKCPGPWTQSGLGFWNLTVDSTTVYSQSSIAGDALASIGAPADDQIVQVRARLDTFASPNGTTERWFGVMARHVDEQNFYLLALTNGNTVSLRKVVNGKMITLASASYAVMPASWYRLRLDAVGDSLRAYVNGTLLVEATDDSLPSGNSGPAMFRTAADFDDFSAYQP